MAMQTRRRRSPFASSSWRDAASVARQSCAIEFCARRTIQRQARPKGRDCHRSPSFRQRISARRSAAARAVAGGAAEGGLLQDPAGMRAFSAVAAPRDGRSRPRRALVPSESPRRDPAPVRVDDQEDPVPRRHSNSADVMPPARNRQGLTLLVGARYARIVAPESACESLRGRPPFLVSTGSRMRFHFATSSSTSRTRLAS
jgi:hypothetical protein